MIHNVAVAWDDLLSAFSNMEQDRYYYFDKFTGEIFSLSPENDDALEQVEQQSWRFLEIPGIDTATERTLLHNFLQKQSNKELASMMDHALSGKPPFAKPSDILAFFPEEEQLLYDLRESFLHDRVKNWMDENELFSMADSTDSVN